uniref:Ig-like domain-containing protein n=1 Tax=Macrostomum lignano TaxID=282301 RepID=A0A1I8JQR8_9PLAT
HGARRQRCQHQWIRCAAALYIGRLSFSVAVCVALHCTMSDLTASAPVALATKGGAAAAAGSAQKPNSDGHGGLLALCSGCLRGSTGEVKTCRYALYLARATAGFTLDWGPAVSLSQQWQRQRRSAPAREAITGTLRRLIFPRCCSTPCCAPSQIISSCVLTLDRRLTVQGGAARTWMTSDANKLAATKVQCRSMPAGKLSGCAAAGRLSEGDTPQKAAAEALGGRTGTLLVPGALPEPDDHRPSWPPETVSIVLLPLSVLCGGERVSSAPSGSANSRAMTRRRTGSPGGTLVCVRASGPKSEGSRGPYTTGVRSVETALRSQRLSARECWRGKEASLRQLPAPHEEEEECRRRSTGEVERSRLANCGAQNAGRGRKQAGQTADVRPASAKHDKPCCRFCSPDCRPRLQPPPTAAALASANFPLAAVQLRGCAPARSSPAACSTLGQTYWCKAVLRDLDDSETGEINWLPNFSEAGGLTCAAIQSNALAAERVRTAGPLSEGDTQRLRLGGRHGNLYFRGPRYLSLMTTAQLPPGRCPSCCWPSPCSGASGSSAPSGSANSRAMTSALTLAQSARTGGAGSVRASGPKSEVNRERPVQATESVVETASASNGWSARMLARQRSEPSALPPPMRRKRRWPRGSTGEWREAASPLWEPRTPARAGKQAAAAGCRLAAPKPTSRCCRFCSPGCRGRGCSSAHGQHGGRGQFQLGQDRHAVRWPPAEDL